MNVQTADLEHLRDHVVLVTLSIEVRLRLLAPDRDPAVLKEAAKLLEQLEARIAKRAADHSALAATVLMRRLGLSPTEMHVIWLGAALAMSPDARAMLTRASGELGPDPTLHAIKLLVHGELPAPAAFTELSARGTLRRLGLLERSDTGDVHESRQTWALSSRILAMLHGENQLDPSLAGVCRIVTDGLRVQDIATSPEALALARRAVTTSEIVIATGLPGLGRRTLLSAAARARGRSLLEIDARKLATDHAALSKQLRSIARECALVERTPLVTHLDALIDGDTQRRLDIVADEFLTRHPGLVLATSSAQLSGSRWERPTILIELTRPCFALCELVWRRALGPDAACDAEQLATRYPLAPGFIHRGVEAARARTTGAKLTLDDLRAGIRTVLEDRLGHYAHRVAVTQSWDDLVLPADQLDAIVELIARVRERRRVYEHWGFAAKLGRGLGVSALLSGPPGTGKTMVAGLIANELGLELYQVDLGKVVSKWIGETEKHLAAMFDAAEAGHAILLFDEADALFGKRTDVKTSTDRYANLETNYLLQRLESFTGICLLTSNHERNIDPAFARRLSLHLRFAPPDAEQRGVLWRTMIPPGAPVALDLELGDLAHRFPISPGHIRNAALRAAFLAADEDSAITTQHLERAAILECEALGRLAS